MMKIKFAIIVYYFLCFQSTTIASTRINTHEQTFHGNLIQLKGDWQFYFGNFLTASEMRSLPEKQKQLIHAVESWHTLPNKKYLPWGIATYYKRVVVTHKNRSILIPAYGMRVGTIMCAYRLYINDSLVGSVGSAEKDQKKFRPYVLPISFYFATKADTIDIVLHISNFFNSNYAGIGRPLYFGTSQDVEKLTLRKYLFSLAMLVTLLLLFLHQLTLSFFESDRKIHVALALITLLLLDKAIIEGDVRVSNFFPSLDYIMLYKIWTLSLLATPAIFYLATLYFRRVIPPILDKIVYSFFTFYLLIVVFADMQFQHHFIWVVVFFSGCSHLYILYILITGIVKHQNYAIIHTISMVFFLGSLVHDLITVSVLHVDDYYAPLMSVIFISLQTTITIIKQSKAQQQVYNLSNQLSRINQNLENEVKERTFDLLTANKELSEVNKQKDLLISTISHDLMNDFNKLLFYSKSLHKDAQQLEPIRAKALIILQSAKKSYNILETILFWAKAKNSFLPKLEAINNLKSIIDENVYIQSDTISEKELQVDVNINNTLHFQCDKGQLNTIIRNLLSNAIKYCNTHGKIQIRNQKKGDWIQLIVQDNGIGMPEDLCQSLLTRPHYISFKGANGETGNGVGLTIVKDLIESNAGRLKCMSQLGHGTTFIVEFKHIKLCDDEKNFSR
jgi:signal transduction histidine kinase